MGRFFVVNMQTILGTKIDQTQKFLDNGTRIPVTRLWVSGNIVVSIKTNSVQLGHGVKKNPNKALVGQIKGANLKTAPKFLREVKFEGEKNPQIGTVINAVEVFKPGDFIDVTGISKGKGYAGVVKRHHFKGGPRTHGQSDRERAPGSIGQTTTPGRVYKGKRMAGRMGHERVTIKNLEVVGVSEEILLVKGLVPGGKNTLVMITKVGENKKFVPLSGTKEVQEKETEFLENKHEEIITDQPVHNEENIQQSREKKQTKDSLLLKQFQTSNAAKKPYEGTNPNLNPHSNSQSLNASEADYPKFKKQEKEESAIFENIDESKEDKEDAG